MIKKLVLIILFLLSAIMLATNYFNPVLLSDSLQYGGGLVYGQVLGFNMYDELVPLEWAKVMAFDENGEIVESVSTLKNGYYEMFLPVGKFQLKVECPGYIEQTMDIAVSSGSSISVNFYLKQSGIPIPEFPYPILQLLIVLALLIVIKIMKSKKFSIKV